MMFPSVCACELFDIVVVILLPQFSQVSFLATVDKLQNN